MATRTTSNHRPQLRQPRLAEMIAGILRERILEGELEDGDFLPKQEELLEEFQVSKPSLREALRVLETEGLVTVRRGNLGGAEVHVPKPESAAYMFGLVLQSRRVTLGDLATALQLLEPTCAGLCAVRDQREELVVPHLQELLDQSEEHIDDAVEYTRISRRFHEELVHRCGNETMILLIGTLETLWSAQEEEWAAHAVAGGEYPDKRLRRAGLTAHRRIVDAIEAGDQGRAARTARKHLEQTQTYALGADLDSRVEAAALRVT